MTSLSAPETLTLGALSFSIDEHVVMETTSAGIIRVRLLNEPLGDAGQVYTDGRLISKSEPGETIRLLPDGQVVTETPTGRTVHPIQIDQDGTIVAGERTFAFDAAGVLQTNEPGPTVVVSGLTPETRRQAALLWVTWAMIGDTTTN